MYRASDDTLVLSPSDLTAFLACEHLTQLERLVAEGQLERPERHDPELEVLRRHGDRHERAELARLEEAGLDVVRIDSPGRQPDELRRAEAATVAAMRAGAAVIFQAAFFDGRWRGQADFLRRVDAPSELGPWSYEVVDTKLARRAKPEALVQLCCYAEQVARLQGVWPEHVEVITGDAERHRFRVVDVLSYQRSARSRFEAALETEAPVTYPEPVAHCSLCAWSEACEQRRRSDDHLSLVAGMRGDTARALIRAGVTTVTALAASADGDAIPGVTPTTAERLRSQARLQLLQRGDGMVRHELRPPDGPDHGLAALPAPSPGDVFLDLEGDPWVEPHGIEYLWGLVGRDDEGELRFSCHWGHDEAGEQAAFEAVVDEIVARLEAHPDMHVYHYAPYEASALKRLAGRYGTRQAEVDRLLRGKVLVDLYRVVRQGIRVSQEGYGLKKLEPLYLDERDGAVTDGGSSIVVYEEWLESGDPRLLEDIRAYNEIDCRSTLGLRDWLEERRAELAEQTGEPMPRPHPADGDPSDDVAAVDAESAGLVARLMADVPADPESRTAEQQATWLLAQLVGWHRREDRPEWWSWFDRLVRSDEELVADHDALGDLRYEGVVAEVDRSLVHRYRFDPVQEHKMAVGDKPVDPSDGGRAGQVVAVDNLAGTIDLKRGRSSTRGHPRSLVPPQPYDSAVPRRAVARLATWVADNGVDHPGPVHRAARQLLQRLPPAVAGQQPGVPLVEPGERPLDAARRLALRLDDACLAVQGPPGSGKTYTGAHLVVDLVAAGHRVAITAQSHKAIGNLLSAVCERAAEQGIEPRILQKASADQRCDDGRVTAVAEAGQVVDALAEGAVDVVAGTAWLFARPELSDSFHTLVVDEAGQLALAQVLAVSGAARNLVLLGDPQQLAQPSKGVHPPGADASALEHLLEGRATVPPTLGLFLDQSHRMHPEVCRFVSDVAYDGRLESAADCGKQAVGDGGVVAGAGLRWLPVQHEGNRIRSMEEAEAVARVVASLLGRSVTGRDGQERLLTLADILVIAPYNAQVAVLAEALPPGARVGTVDRFQGQEAPVVLYSLAASSAADVPRGLDFLFSLNRLNVAVSRARALAVIVASPALLAARCRTPRQLRLVNALCRFVELAEPVEP